MPVERKTSVTYHLIDEAHAGQRLDHFLFHLFKHGPKTLVYRIIRTGQVRINKRRTTLNYRLMEGDLLRIPPVIDNTPLPPLAPKKHFHVLYEDDDFLVLDKPPHVASHGGSGITFGVIEQLKRVRPEAKYLHLVHRLDKETSGLLMVAKKHNALVRLHEILRQGLSEKHYYALLLGQVALDEEKITVPLKAGRTSDGKKYVRVHSQGSFARTILTVIKRYDNYTLVDALLKTGRTHQIRVHAQHIGHPVASDPLYGNFDQNKTLAKQGLKRMFLHAHRITLPHPTSHLPLIIESQLPIDLQKLLHQLVEQ